MTIGVIGLGYVGLTFAIAAAMKGIDVYGVETDSYIKQCLGECRAHFYEPGLDALIEKHTANRFWCMEQFPEDREFDAFLITVGTPLKENAKTPNFEYLVSALDAIRKVYTGKELVIVRSTVSVGTTRKIVLKELMKMGNLKENQVLVSMCPERTIEGKAIEELTGLPQIISGNTDKALEMAQMIFRRLTPYVVEVDSLEEAELVKLYCNIYRDMNFAMGNVLNAAAQDFGVNGLDVIRFANMGYDRSNIACPGFVAGPCLEKDAYIMMANMKSGKSKDFISAMRSFNESLEEDTVNWVKRIAGKPEDDKEILLTGMAFKGVPETSDLRGSSSVYIAQKLAGLGYKLRLHDFVATCRELEKLELGRVYQDLNEACKGIQVLLVLNNCARYRTYRFLDTKGKKVLDIWDVCDGLRDNNVRYTIGNMLIEEEGA